MRVLVISDLHANLQATEAVLSAAAGEGWDRVLVLGDLVGYGADPAAVIDTVRALPHALVIRGNHDKVVAGIDSAADFNGVARSAAEWTIASLDAERLSWLRELPHGPYRIPHPGLDIEICHGAPFDEDYYIFDTADAERALDATTAPLVCCGHTHLQMAFREMRSVSRRVMTPVGSDLLALGADTRTLVNPGSVGQPRDGDPRAGYALVDTSSSRMVLRRVPYDIGEAQRRILAAGLHPHLAERLSMGR